MVGEKFSGEYRKGTSDNPQIKADKFQELENLSGTVSMTEDGEEGEEYYGEGKKGAVVPEKKERIAMVGKDIPPVDVLVSGGGSLDDEGEIPAKAQLSVTDDPSKIHRKTGKFFSNLFRAKQPRDKGIKK